MTRRADRVLGALMVAGGWSVAAYLLFLGLAAVLYARTGVAATTTAAAMLVGLGHVPPLTLFALLGLAARRSLGHARGTRLWVGLTVGLGVLAAAASASLTTAGPPLDGIASPLAGSPLVLVAGSVVNSLWLALQVVVPVLLWRARRAAARRRRRVPRLQAAAVASLVPLCVVTFCSLLGLAATGEGGAVVLLAGMATAWPLTAAGYALAVRGRGRATVLTARVLARVGALLIGLLAAMTALSVVLIVSLRTGMGNTLVVAVVTLAVAAALRPVGARVHAALVGGSAIVAARPKGVGRRGAAPERRLERLTPREHEVLALLAAGRSNAGIAAELVLSQRTVDAHLRSIFHKLDLPDGRHDNRRVQAVLAWAQDRQPPPSAGRTPSSAASPMLPAAGGPTVWAPLTEGAPGCPTRSRACGCFFLPLLVLPVVFISDVVLPHTFLASHALFHLVYIPVIVVAVRTCFGYAREAPSALTRNLARTVGVFQLVGLFGRVGELVTVFLSGGFGAPADLFEDSWHRFFANFAPTGLAASVLALIALTVVAAVGSWPVRRVRRVRRVRQARAEAGTGAGAGVS